MSTHALIGVPTATGYKARYVHSDGYTKNMMPAIKRCIQNHKVAGDTFSDAVFYMLGNHWSSFSISGHVYTKGNHDVVFYTEDADIDAEYLYLLDDNEVTPYIRTGEGWMAINLAKTIKMKGY